MNAAMLTCWGHQPQRTLLTRQASESSSLFTVVVGVFNVWDLKETAASLHK
jgi:hypothetical protein